MTGASRASRPGRHDPAARRRAQRKGRETGAWFYLSGAQLLAAGFEATAPPPFYRAWPSRRGRVVVNLYREA